jgi:hypothetical protein
MLYCDHCGTKNGYDIEPDKKVKGECQLCHRRIGPMNEMTEEDVKVLVNGIEPTIYDIAGFKVEEVEGFPVGKKIDDIEKTMLSHRVVGNNCVCFFDAHKIVVANPKTGKRFTITF